MKTDELVIEKMRYGSGRLVNGKNMFGGFERRWYKRLRIKRKKGFSLLLEFECYLVVQ